ncbi:MAG: T9SS type A sorting domain-containing protein, partial [Bacteroidetes bacterium]|nr:T9SS type A sorting domain-containing protein [Bacteroidota bacterium]
GNILQNGMTTVQTDDLVVIPQIEVFKENIRKVRITISDESTAIEDLPSFSSGMYIYPNPARDIIFLKEEWIFARIYDLNGVEKMRLKRNPSSQRLDISALSEGIYFIETTAKDGIRKVGRFVKL